MTNTLVFPRVYFLSLLQRLAGDADRIVWCIVGTSHLDRETLYLVRRIEIDHTHLSAREKENSITVSLGNEPSLIPKSLGYLVFDSDMMEGKWHGMIKTSSGATAGLDCIRIVGAGMHVFFAANAHNATTPLPIREVYPRFSRTISAIGPRHWRRLTNLRVALVGCGRSGSIVAVTLAKMGVQSLTLIDPDRLETHNITEMDGVTDADIGRPKVDVLAEYLTSHCASREIPLQITTAAEPITAAHRSALSADVLISCVDNDAARFACGILATLFHKVLLDIGTGINLDGEKGREMGIDVRLILPATGCLHCVGSVANYEEALTNLIRRNLPDSNRSAAWWVQRGGSLRTLNMMAVSIGVQLLCDLVAERIDGSRWTRLEYDTQGNLTVELLKRGDKQAMARCQLCAKAGLGERGLLWCLPEARIRLIKK